MPNKLTHAALVSGLRRLDRRAIEQLYHEVGPEIIAYIRRQLLRYGLRAVYTPRGVFHRVFMRLLTHLARGDYDVSQRRNFNQLLTAAAGRCVIGLARRRGHDLTTPEPTPEAEPDLEEIVDDHEPSALAESREVLARVRAAVTEWEWELLNLHVEGRRGWDEIASILGGTPEGVRKKFQRLVRRLSRLNVD